MAHTSPPLTADTNEPPRKSKPSEAKGPPEAEGSCEASAGADQPRPRPSPQWKAPVHVVLRCQAKQRQKPGGLRLWSSCSQSPDQRCARLLSASGRVLILSSEANAIAKYRRGLRFAVEATSKTPESRPPRLASSSPDPACLQCGQRVV